MKDEKLQAQIKESREHIKRTSTWFRGLHIILFALLFNIAELVIGAVVLFQFLHALLSGKANKRLLTFGQSLSTYAYQILAYITYNSDHRPYPFGAWPKGAPNGVNPKSSMPKEVASSENPEGDVDDTDPAVTSQ
mgnify:CR=1 FL=1